MTKEQILEEVEFEGPFVFTPPNEQYLCVMPRFKIVASGSTQFEALEKALISLKVLVMYTYKIKP